MYDRVLFAIVLWREARGQSMEAKIAVAHSIKNRVDRPAWWGTTLVQVLTKKWQYSSMTDPNDKQLTFWPKETDDEFHQCMSVACGVLDGIHANPIPGADSYFDDSIPAPKWAAEHPLRFKAKIGAFNFYDMDQDFELKEGNP